MTVRQKSPVHTAIETVSSLPSDDPAWASFMRETLKLPDWMVPAAQEAVRQYRWKVQPNPIGYLRTATHRIAARMALTADDFKGPTDRSRLCQCGRMFLRQAALSGHTCIAGEIDSFHYKIPDLSNSDDVTGTRYDATDLINILGHPQDEMCADFSFECIDEDGIQYSGHYLLERINPEFLKLHPPEIQSATSPNEREYGHPICGSYDWGSISIDWQRLAEALGFGIPDSLVMEFRFSRGYSRKDLLSMPVSKKTRRQFQAAWRRITMRFDEIRSMLLHNPERQAWNVRMASSARFHNRPWSTAGRKQPIQIPERSYKLNGLEAELASMSDPDRFANADGCGRELMRDGVWLVPQAKK